MTDVTFTYESDACDSRQAYRARVRDLSAVARADGQYYSVHDISAAGISLEIEGAQPPLDAVLEVDVFIREKPVVTGLKAQVARHAGPVVGLKFTDLTEQQEQRLDKLVLEVQKYLISKSRSSRCPIDDEHET
uniref:PilZ domain-containing protein n=1 Tax=Fundidesulfovibrio putealis TaxID=270496 RepID=A0A7C4EJ87_9BACT